MLLSDRMQAVVGLINACDCIADVGCDHGYVAIELIRRGVCKHVIAMDINQGPLECAKGNIKAYEMVNYIETRLSDGVQALIKGEADGIICAGMGGKLIISILEQGKEVVSQMKQLVLQPQSEVSEVRSYLRENGYIIDKEDMIFEDGKYYPMMRVIPCGFGKQEVQMADNLQQKHKKLVADEANKYNPPTISEVSLEETEKIIEEYSFEDGEVITADVVKYKKCSECGATISGDSEKCFNCGEEIGKICNVCGAKLKKDDYVCSSCGAIII